MVPPCPRSVPRVGMVPSPPCERKHNVTPKVLVLLLAVLDGYRQLKSTMITVGYEMFVWSLGYVVSVVLAPEPASNGNQ